MSGEPSALPGGATERARRLLPLHDDTEPITCTIADDERADRVALLTDLRTAMTSLDRTDTGLLLTFPRTARIDADVRRFVADEKRCCRFWGFAVVDGEHDLVLRWDGPPSAAAVLDAIEEALRSDDPIEGIDGIL